MLDPSSTAPPPDQLLQPPPKQKRSSVACRRCRRLRAKCVKEEKDGGLCRGCLDAGVPQECEYLPRGMSAIDRAPRPAQRRKRQRRDVSPDHSLAFPQAHAVVNGICSCCHQPVPATVGSSVSGQPISPTTHEELLPPQDELVDACEWFFSTYFQLGFLHKPTFMHTLITAPQSISTFLLLSMLSISARFSPRLIERYGTGANAADVFARQAQKLAGEELVGAATLDRAQAFFLCSIWSWGSGYRDRSWIYLGVAARMASILKLSQESSYNLSPDASVEAVIKAEVSRRTWWVIFMSDNLLSSGCGRPISFDLDQVTIPLPLDEDHFSFGYQGPTTVLPGTKAKGRPRHEAPFNAPQIDPQLQAQSHPPPEASADGGDVNSNDIGERSLYGNLVTIADIWARVARSALVRSQPSGTPAPASANLAPWHPDSDYKIINELDAWEATLGPRQSWSMSNLLAYQSKNLDMGFRGIFLFMHLSHIVMRRSYLPMLAHDVQNGQQSSIRTGPDRQSLLPPPRFWETMVHDLFAHALKAIELVKSWVPTRPFSRGCTPMMGFSLFMAGSVLAYLRKWKWLCPSLYPYTQPAIQNALDMIADIAVVWPNMGARWHAALSQASAESDAPNALSLNGHRDRGVEGLGRAAEEDLIVDQREGMYRHKSMEEFEEKVKQQEHSPIPPPPDLNGLLNHRDIKLPPLGTNRNRSESASSVQNPNDAHMLYSLATAASMDQKMGPGSNPNMASPTSASPSSANGHHPGHVGSHGSQGLNVLPPPFFPSSNTTTTSASENGQNSMPMDWNHFQTDITTLLQDGLNNPHLEHGGNGWAF